MKAQEVTGFDYAVIAIRYFQRRNERIPMFKHATRPYNQRQTNTNRIRSREMTRFYIAKARAAGYRGFPVQEILHGVEIECHTIPGVVGDRLYKVVA